jgi:hypothetical protein
MNSVFHAGLFALAASAFLATGPGVAPAEAQQSRRGVTTSSDGMNQSYQAGPRTRIFVTKRSWLDLGTEVKPGDRGYTNYAIPPGYSVADQLIPNGNWRRQHLPDPWDLPGYNKTGYGR